MSRIVFHGSNHLQSRQEFSRALDQAKKSGISDVVYLDKKNYTREFLIQASESQSLFGTERILILDSILSQSTRQEKEFILDFLSHTTISNILLWHPQVLTSAQLNKLTTFSIRIFKTSPTIFKFLENYDPHSPSKYLDLFDSACEQDSPEFVFHMLLRHLRELLTVDASFHGPSWKKSKLTAQLNHIGKTNLVKLHHRFYLLDTRQKTGVLNTPFKQALLRTLLVTT